MNDKHKDDCFSVLYTVFILMSVFVLLKGFMYIFNKKDIKIIN